MFDFNEAVAAVTGGVKGIGFENVKCLLEAGIKKCGILDSDEVKGEEVEKLFNVNGEIRVKYFKCDVTKMADFEAAILKVLEAFGKLDLLINTAEILDEIEWERSYDVNLKVVVNGVNLGLRFMGKNNGGNGGIIINMPSICGFNPFSPIPVYSATKFTVNGITRTMGSDYYYGETGVRLSALCLGITQEDLLGYQDDELHVLRTKETTALPLKEHQIMAEALKQVVLSGGNGTIWVCEGGQKAYEIFLPSRAEEKKKE